ncbi:MAG: Holliday junction branch migration protein RuvA [Streptomycetaceae bacterium]|nr:MAG: Holliday junction branch migration protein RuvA [Streptomycetaceae bacterium]
MISSLFGRILHLSADRAVVDISGVGFSVLITPVTSSRLSVGNDAQLFTSLVVREDSLTLFGFLDEDSRSLFELVQTVSGIGPKVAMAILAVMSPDDLSSAVAQENIAAIERVPGIGRKGAQRMILELKGKISDFSSSHATISHVAPWREQLTSALMSLGYSAKESDGAVANVIFNLQESGEDPALMAMGDLLKAALQNGGRSRGAQ